MSDNDFVDIDPTYAAQFNSFSAPKTFAPIGSENSEVTFVVPGSDIRAGVAGFGVVFSDETLGNIAGFAVHGPGAPAVYPI